VVVFGYAPPWQAFTLWLAIDVLVALLWRAVHDQAERERAQRDTDRGRLDELAARLDDIEQALYNDPPEKDNQ
jgi:hypothetical protein